MPSPREGEIGFRELHTQLRIISRLLAAQLRATTGQQDLVRLLVGTGASHGEIADVLNTTPATIATTVQRLKRRDTNGPAVSQLGPPTQEDENEKQ